ncbi:hypothetical protein ACO0K0_11345 [Undibacterium sp. SXout11W]|uniref:hypothetical protein n=1 Tax=Undibacterium sp. SXout11W TaxID=3413050 RepID=UPI003BF2F014
MNNKRNALSNQLKYSILAALISIAPLSHTADCLSCTPSTASEAMSLGIGMVVYGSMSAIAGSGDIVVTSVETAADGVSIVVTASGQAIRTTIKLSGKAIEKSALVSGIVIEVSATSTGYLLIASGKAIAFIPNEVGNALLHHHQVQ